MAVLVITHRNAWDAHAQRRYTLEAGRIERVEHAIGA
jgi:ABC-type transport system involved in cytochrome bd biosynthesis fused ATPase/permease subunit